MQDFQFLDIVLFGLLAAFVGFRLYTVLGRRTGQERTRDDRLQLPDGAQPNPKAPPAKDNVIALPDRPVAATVSSGGPLARALMDIKLHDRTFDADKFLAGARSAYEMVVTAFARGDRDTLHHLLSEDVFQTFNTVITARETKKERVDFTFLKLKSARITAAEMKGHMADVTVTFESEVMMAGYDPKGTLIEGDPQTPRQVTEVWTFARDTQLTDPNWQLVATASGS